MGQGLSIPPEARQLRTASEPTSPPPQVTVQDPCGCCRRDAWLQGGQEVEGGQPGHWGKLLPVGRVPLVPQPCPPSAERFPLTLCWQQPMAVHQLCSPARAPALSRQDFSWHSMSPQFPYLLLKSEQSSRGGSTPVVLHPWGPLWQHCRWCCPCPGAMSCRQEHSQAGRTFSLCPAG